MQIDNSTWQLYPTCILESINWIPFTFLFKIFNKINNIRFANEIKKAIKTLDFKDYKLFNDSDMFRSFNMPELLKPETSVYYTRDNMMSVAYWYKHGHILKPQLMKKSNIVTANSTYLANVAKQYNELSFYVGQGCKTNEFDLDKINNIPNVI